MKITNIEVYRDGGTMGIHIDGSRHPIYHCNPGAFGTKKCISLESDFDQYSGPNIDFDTAKELLEACKSYQIKNDMDSARISAIAKTIYEIYPELIPKSYDKI